MDLQALWVNNNRGNSLSPVDPRAGRLAGPPIAVRDPYNLYFTPDGTSAMVMAEALGEIDFYDPHTWTEQFRLRLDRRCRGVNHVDFSPDGSYAIATCEFSGQLVKVDLTGRWVLGYLDLNGRPGAGVAAPQAACTWSVAGAAPVTPVSTTSTTRAPTGGHSRRR